MGEVNNRYKYTPTFITLIAALSQYKDIYVFLRDALLSSKILVGAFLLLILPYLIPVIRRRFKSERFRNLLNLLSINKLPGLIIAWISSSVFAVITVGGLILAALWGIGAETPKVLIPQLNWPYYKERNIAANGGLLETKVYAQYKGKTDVVKIIFDTRNPNSYALWMVTFPNVSFLQNWTKYPYVSFQIRAENNDISYVVFGIKDRSGLEVKKEISKFIIGEPPIDSSKWRTIEIDLTKLSSELQRPLDWQNLDNISFSLGHIDPDLTKDYVSFFVSELTFWENQ